MTTAIVSQEVPPLCHPLSAENKLVLNVDKEKLKTAPGFDKDAKWPDFADRAWGYSIHDYYGYAPYWKP